MVFKNSATTASEQQKSGKLFRLDLSYVGTKFDGFQSQASKNAIQDHIEKALNIIFKEKIRIRGASRTDSGVHAHHQVLTFRTQHPYDPKWLFALNALTPSDIGIFKLQPAAEDFDPIVSCKAKTYRYRIWQGKCFNPFISAYVWSLNHQFDVHELNAEAKHFVGTHDFTSFCNRDSQAKTTHRRILSIHCEQRGPMIDIWITGEGFLKQMVRIMVGTLVAISKGQLPKGAVKELLSSQKGRSYAGMTAPAQGLALVRIFYNNIIPLQDMIQKTESKFCLPFYDDFHYILSGGRDSIDNFDA